MFNKLKSWLAEVLVPYRCEHEWERIKQIETSQYDEPWCKYPSHVYMDEIWQCKKCGRVKQYRYEI